MKSRLWKFHSRCQEFEHICPRIRPPIFVFPRIPNGVPLENWKLPLQNFHAYGIEILFIQVWSGAISYVLLLPSLKILKILIFFRLHAIVLHTIEKSILRSYWKLQNYSEFSEHSSPRHIFSGIRQHIRLLRHTRISCWHKNSQLTLNFFLT